MRSRLSSRCFLGLTPASFALLLLVWSGSGHAGLSLDAALALDADPQARRLGLAAPEAPSGWGLGWGASNPTPQGPLIANDFVGRGGLRMRSGAWSTGPWQLRLGVDLREGGQPFRRVGFDGSSVAYQFGSDPGDGELYASVERRHWGPAWAGSLILDGAAPAVPAFGWRRTAVRTSTSPWLSWLGPWGADFFMGRLQGHREAARPQFIGMRVVLEPTDGIEIGLTRTLQWGGRGRDESWRSLANALLGHDNVGGDGILYANEPGNQLAGGDLRWTFDRATRSSVYGQLIGEDEAGGLPSRSMGLVGIDTRLPIASGGSMRFFVEVADTLAGRATGGGGGYPFASYRHPIYQQGYTQEGFVLGHPAGGDVLLGSMGWLYQAKPFAGMLVVAAGNAEPSATSFAPGRVRGLNAALHWDLDARLRIQARWVWWSDAAGRRHAVQLGLHVKDW